MTMPAFPSTFPEATVHYLVVYFQWLMGFGFILLVHCGALRYGKLLMALFMQSRKLEVVGRNSNVSDAVFRVQQLVALKVIVCSTTIILAPRNVVLSSLPTKKFIAQRMHHAHLL
jgi:hypothetical protein